MSSTPKILVTGATGLVGSCLLFDLVRRGHWVRATKRSDSSLALVKRYFKDSEKLLDEKVEWVVADVLDIDEVADAMVGIHEVYHCAAMVMFDPRKKKKIIETNAQGTANVVNMALAQGVKKFCHFSSVAALGKGRGHQQIDEDSVLDKHRDYHHYGLSKHRAEREVWRGMAEGLEVIVMNPAVIVGPGDWKYDSSYIVTMVDRGLKFYTPGRISVVDVRDVTDAAINLMESETKGEQFIASAENIPYKKFLGLIATNLKTQQPSVKVSPLVVNTAWRLAMAFSWLSGRSNPLTREPAEATYSHTSYSGAKLKSWRGKEYISAQQMINDCCDLYRKEKKEY